MGRKGYIVPVDPQLKGVDSSCSWILINCWGQCSEVKLNKYAIMHRLKIDARDLRLLDPHLSYPSTILGRDKAILLNLEYIRAIITADEVLLQDPWEENVIPVVQELKRQLCPGKGVLTDQTEQEFDERNVEAAEEEGKESPFEFRALEVVLDSICSFLAVRTTELETDAYPALDDLTSKISSRNLDRIRKLKSAMTRLTARVQKVRDELEKFLDDDDDMVDLYLSRKLAPAASPVPCSGLAKLPSSPTLDSKISKASVITIHGDDNDVEEVEMLLEAYFMHIEGTLNKITTLREYIDDTEDYINIQIDNLRNQLIQLELFLSSGTLSLAIFSLVTAIFGVNLKYKWNHGYDYMFKWVIIVTGLVTAFLFLVIISYARYKGLVGS